jgi:hypothetical protein
MILPATERFGSLGPLAELGVVRSAQQPRSSGSVRHLASARLPADLVQLTNVPLLPSDEEILGWVNVPIDRWSLQSLDTPIYPQARFQFGVAREIAGMVDSETHIRVIGSGVRESLHRSIVPAKFCRITCNSTKLQHRYWLNTRPRN